jgi:hypothetical protein
MLELYCAEACELDPPSEGVGYGDLEASMAMSGAGGVMGGQGWAGQAVVECR